MIFKREIEEGYKIPTGYGVAYWQWNRRAAVCYPVPMNWIIKWARDVWFFLISPTPAGRDRIYWLGWHDGRKRAFQSGYEGGYERGCLDQFHAINEWIKVKGWRNDVDLSQVEGMPLVRRERPAPRGSGPAHSESQESARP